MRQRRLTEKQIYEYMQKVRGNKEDIEQYNRFVNGMNKYHNQKTVIDDIEFHSAREGRRYEELKLRLRAGEIQDLELQPRYDFVINGKKLKHYYKADFRYREVATGMTVVEDVKGFKTQCYRLKKELVEALYDIEITEI